MKRIATGPSLSDDNRLYLYNLLREQLGCGKQTFLPVVEEALATDAMTAEDLGFASTRELLEALGDVVELKVFKGGRVYATVVAKPEWDAALEAAGKPEPADAKAARGNKPWKRKKGAKGKALKPQRPRRVKREEPVVEPAVDDAVEGPVAVTVDGAGAQEASSKPAIGAVSTGRDGVDAGVSVPSTAEGVSSQDGRTSSDTSRAVAPDAPGAQDPTLRNDRIFSLDDDAAEAADQAAPRAGEPVLDEQAAPAPAAPDAPAIALTVTYDPYTGNDEETLLVAEVPAAAVKEPARDVVVDDGSAVDAGFVAESAVSADEDTVEGSAAEGSRQQAESSPDDRVALEPVPAPSISFTITYDPSAEVGDDFVGETVHEDDVADPVTEVDDRASSEDTAARGAAAGDAVSSSEAVAQDVPAQSKAEPTPQPVVAPAAGASVDATRPRSVPVAAALADAALPHTAPSAQALASYPRDFTREVTIPGDVLLTLTHVMPLHANVLQILTEDFRIARGMATVVGTRAQATFPLRYAGVDGASVLVTIKRAGRAGWSVVEVLNIDDAVLATSGMDGLPLMDLDATARVRVAAARKVYLDEGPLEALASQAFPQVWSAATLRDHLAFAIANGAPLEGGQLATGLFGLSGDPLVASLEQTGDDIPWRLI